MYDNSPKFKQQTIVAIVNLATATANDQATVAKLTETIADLTTELKKTQTKLVTALEANARLANNNPTANKENARSARNSNRHY